MNILNMIREQISPETLGQISKSVGESPEGTKSALEQALPALLGSAASEAASPKGATDLFSSITREAPKLGSLSGILGSLGGTGGGGPGASFVSSLLGPKMNMVRDFISGRAGIRTESGTSLLGMAGSLLIGALGKQMMTQKLDVAGFGQLLRSQIPHLQGLLPPELTKTLGLGNLLGTTPTQPAAQPSHTTPAYETASHATAAAPSSGAKALKWAVIPLALLLAGIFLYRHSRNTDVGGTREETYTTTNRVTGSSYVDTTSFTDRFKNALANPTGSPIDLQGVGYDSLGGLSSDAKTKLSALGKMINNYPSLKVAITTYGKTEDDAASRANAIKSALATAGVSTDRVTTETAVGEGWPKISFTK
jgi:hypothetical protein